jgi:hypothetical protein
LKGQFQACPEFYSFRRSARLPLHLFVDCWVKLTELLLLCCDMAAAGYLPASPFRQEALAEHTFKPSCFVLVARSSGGILILRDCRS